MIKAFLVACLAALAFCSTSLAGPHGDSFPVSVGFNFSTPALGSPVCAPAPHIVLILANTSAGPTNTEDGVRNAVSNADAQVNASAETGGGTAHYRLECDVNGVPIVHVENNVPATTFTGIIGELQSRGYTSDDYFIWYSYRGTGGCGTATVGPGGGVYALSWSCFNPIVAAHELGHVLGAVAYDAPHSSGAFHCWDENDIMCYNDFGPYFANGGTIQVLCPGPEVFDCNHDDYFSPNPAPGSYLATHWNTFNSPWLQTTPGITATAVKLRSFLASRKSQKQVVVKWNTASENDVLGFRVYSGSHSLTRLVVARGHASSYTQVLTTKASKFKLQQVALDGSSSWVASAST